MTDEPLNAEELERLKSALAMDLENHKYKNASALAHWQESAKREHDVWLEDRQTKHIMFRAIIDYSLVTIRSLILINGAAVIGILTFTGNLWVKEASAGRDMATAIGPAMEAFVYGLGFAVLTAALSYVSQVLIAELPTRKLSFWIGGCVRIVACVLAILSFCKFVEGGQQSIDTFKKLPGAVTRPLTP